MDEDIAENPESAAETDQSHAVEIPSTALFKFSGSGSVKDIDGKKGIVTAYASAFEVEDSDGDIIERGAYAKTILERGPKGSNRIKMLYMHDFSQPIGKVIALEEDEHGLLFRAQVVGTQRGRDTLLLYEADLLEHSVGLDIIKRRETDRRRISEARLWDVSPVTWGANMNTPLVSMKGATAVPGFTPLDRIVKLRKALRSGLSDEAAITLEQSLAAIEAQLAAEIKAREKEREEKALIATFITEIDKAFPSTPKGEPPAGTRDEEPRTEDQWLSLIANRL